MTNVENEYRHDSLENYSNNFHPRPRSVYTHTEDANNYYYQKYGGDYNDLDTTSEERCCGHVNGSSSSNPVWRMPSRYNLRSYPSLFYAPSEDGMPLMETWHDADVVDNIESGAVIATQYGTMSIRLHSKMRVDMTIDRAIRITNMKSKIAMSLNSTGASAVLYHPNGRIYQYGSRVEILAHDQSGNNKHAKMWHKGVSFTSDRCALIYLVDSAGTRTTTDNFHDLSDDLTLSVFYNESRHGFNYQQEAMHLLKNAQYFVDDKKVQNWIINNVRISQTPDGLLRVAKNSNKYQLRTSPSNGSASITTPYLHATASLGQTQHLFVRRGERRMHYDGTSFIVRNAGHSAGFDEKNKLKVY